MMEKQKMNAVTELDEDQLSFVTGGDQEERPRPFPNEVVGLGASLNKSDADRARLEMDKEINARTNAVRAIGDILKEITSNIR